MKSYGRRMSFMTIAAARSGAIGGLVFLGISSLVGAVPMLREPAGSPLNMPLSLLRYSPFHSFLIPGLILLVANGFLSFVVLWLVLCKRERYAWWVVGQGFVLAGWLLVEIAMLRGANWLHAVYGVVASFLIATGWTLRNGGRTAASSGPSADPRVP
jgi:hypothetical protein